MRVLTVLMGLYFLLAAALQYDDPDPVPWIAIYGAAALACVLAIMRRGGRWLAAGIAVAAVTWAATLAPRVVGRVAPREILTEAGMLTPGVEEAREVLGLLIVVAWMIVLAVAAPAAGARLSQPTSGQRRLG